MTAADEHALVAAVCAAPDADLPRLVYADWCDDHGRPERAEFVRLACQLAAALGDDGRRAERGPLRDRVSRLGRAHGDRWRAELPADKAVHWGRIRRGFVAEARVAFDGRTPADAGLLDRVFAAAPVQELRLVNVLPDLPRCLAHPRLGQLARLELVPVGWAGAATPGFFARLAAHPWPARLEELIITNWSGRADGLERLAEAPPGRPFPRLLVRHHGPLPARPALEARFGDRLEVRT